MTQPRLLWRGSLSIDDNAGEHEELHGLAIIAPAFRLDELLDEPDDPFSSSASRQLFTNSTRDASAAELCLDLEMLRHRPLRVVNKRVQLYNPNSDRGTISPGSHGTNGTAADSEKIHGRKALKKSIEMLRKGKSRSYFGADQDQDPSRLNGAHSGERFVRLDFAATSKQALSVYVDERCGDTLDWCNALFCEEPVDPVTLRTRTGMLVSLAGTFDGFVEDPVEAESSIRNTVVIYGELLIKDTDEREAGGVRPRMQLHIARQRHPKDLGPRPDDPAPRENLFAQKLRRSVSQPSIVLSHSGKGKDAAVSLKSRLNGTASSTLGAQKGLQRSQSTQGLSKARNPFAKKLVTRDATVNFDTKKRSLSSSALGGIGSGSGLQNGNPHASPGRRGQKRPRLTAGGLRQLQEAEDEEDEDDDDEATAGFLTGMRREGSPTPSAATNRSLGLKPPNGTNGRAVKTGVVLGRSASMPPGQLNLAPGARGNIRTRENSLAPSVAGTDAEGKDASLETRNKGSIRKVILSEMIARNIGREHPEFKDLFSVTYRGVCCAFRYTMPIQKLDKIEIIISTRKHLEMYILPKMGQMNPMIGLQEAEETDSILNF